MQPQNIPTVPTPTTQPVNPTVSQLAVALPNVEALASDLGTIKTGWHTSEFWVTVVTATTTLVAGLLPANSSVVKAVSAISAGVMAIVYLVGRVQIKKHAATTTASLLANANNG